jgi:hypothetical protein
VLNRLICILLCWMGVQLAYAQPDAQAILAASDHVRCPDNTFSMSTSLVEFKKRTQTDANSLIVYAKLDPQSGQFMSLIQFAVPARDAGKLMLKNGNDLWMYDPENKASIRLSPKQRLLGQAANGDVVTVNWALDYNAKWSGQETVLDGDRQQKVAHHLDLRARAPEVTYDRIELWIEIDSNRPVKALFYSESGVLLKTAYYRQYKEELGAYRPTEIVIIDGLDPQLVTVMKFSKFAKRDIPASWLQRDYLPRFKADQ